jgi:hypothetical protein
VDYSATLCRKPRKSRIAGLGYDDTVTCLKHSGDKRAHRVSATHRRKNFNIVVIDTVVLGEQARCGCIECLFVSGRRGPQCERYIPVDPIVELVRQLHFLSTERKIHHFARPGENFLSDNR